MRGFTLVRMIIKASRGRPLHARAVCTAMQGLLCAGFASNVAAQTVLHSFTGGPDGGVPFAGLTADDAGNLYGTAWAGGDRGAGCEPLGCGTVFKLAPDGRFTVLHTFMGGQDGSNPGASLTRARDGYLYGTAEQGGAAGYGTIFSINPSGQETVIYAFRGGKEDGLDPKARLTIDKDGNLFGLTNGGGAAGAGVAFKVVLRGPTGAATESVVHAFGSGQDGAYPNNSGLAMDAAGTLYGTTAAGGAAGKGTVFRLSPGGIETILHSFTGADGGMPLGGVTIGQGGDMYGTTFSPGTLFKVTQRGALTTIHKFHGAPDGEYPESAPTTDQAGTLFGTSLSGGSGSGGTVFKIRRLLPDEAGYSVLYNFEPGSQPVAGMARGPGGKLYGTTLNGGTQHKGSIFSVMP